MESINSNRPVSQAAQSKPTKETAKQSEAQVPQKAQIRSDQLSLQNKENSPVVPEPIKLFEDDKKSENGWKIKSGYMNFGYVLDNNVVHSGPMRIVNEANGTDVTISNYHQIDRKSWDYLKISKGQRFAPDEPQFNVGIGVTFENNFGIELDAKHNKIIMDGYDQVVHFEGTINGEEVNGEAPMSDFMRQHEQTLGNLQISPMATYTFDLPAPANHKFSFITKLGPSVITSNTRSRMLNPDEEWDSGTTKLGVVGYGAVAENGIKYQFGPKVARLGLEVSHSFSYLNYANYEMTGGSTGSHSAFNSQFAVKATVGLFGNKH